MMDICRTLQGCSVALGCTSVSGAASVQKQSWPLVSIESTHNRTLFGLVAQNEA